MQSIILAAGMGKRLKELTKDNTKCMVKVNGVTMIERALRQLEKLHLSRIVIVVGYKGKELIDYIETLKIQTPICFVDNPIYDKTNNIYSLALAKEYLLKEDTLLLESDLIFEDDVLKVLIEDQRETLALVDKYQSWMDGTCIRVREDDTIDAFIPGKKFKFDEINNYYKTVNIYKFSKHFSETHYVPFLEAYQKALGENEYYEQVLRVITMLDDPEIKAKRLNGQLWYEIDDIQDLDIASSMFASSDDDKIEMMQSRYGGYWRYPQLIDFCCLVNPYYPPQKLIDEIKASFEKLFTEYPSGLRVNRLLAAKNFGVYQEHIIVGNGASELIKSLMDNISGKVGFIKSIFKEYPNRCNKDDGVIFTPQNPDFSYTVDELIDYFKDKGIKSLVLINPDNPSGNYIRKSDVMRLADWCEDMNIRFILDESFVDFSDEEDSSMISESVIGMFKKMVIIKSISKSYGVSGVRLGILVSFDEKLISLLKNDIAIWNINSFAEFYMQIAEKYNNDYKESLVKYRAVRKHLIEELRSIKQLRVIPSQANYLMVEIIGGMSSRELTKTLLVNHNLFIKDLSGMIDYEDKQYVRIAVRSEEDNYKLVKALKVEFMVC